MIRYAFMILLGPFLLGCTASPIEKTDPMPQITYEHLLQIPVQVSRIEMVNKTQRGAEAWDIANDLTTPPDVALRRYLNQRFIAKGQEGVLQISLAKADIQSNSVPNENKLLSFIPLANNEDYTFEIIIDVASLYRSGQADTETSTRFLRKVKMPLNVTLAYREAILQRTLEEMIRDIDEAMISALFHRFSLINEKDVPVQNMEVKTKVPETETLFGRVAEEVGEGLRQAGEGIEQTFSQEDESEELSKPQPVTPVETEILE